MTSPTMQPQSIRSVSLRRSRPSLSELIAQLGQDFGELAKSEVALAKLELEQKLRDAALSLAASLLGATVALIGFAMLCATAVVALAPLIAELWARMLLVSVIYLVLGSLVAAVFSLQLRRAASRMGAPRALTEARETLAAVTRKNEHG